MIAACGIERWGQRAGEVAAGFRKHTVVVSRWASEARKIGEEDEECAAAIEALDQSLSKATFKPLLKKSEPRNTKVEEVPPG